MPERDQIATEASRKIERHKSAEKNQTGVDHAGREELLPGKSKDVTWREKLMAIPQRFLSSTVISEFRKVTPANGKVLKDQSLWCLVFSTNSKEAMKVGMAK